MNTPSRRSFVKAAVAAAAWPLLARAAPQAPRRFRVRTITAGITMAAVDDFEQVDAALAFLKRARQAFEQARFAVQTTRIATQPLAAYLGDWHTPAALDGLRALDERAVAGKVSFSIGPVLTGNAYVAGFAPFATALVAATKNISFSTIAGSNDNGIHPESARSAAEAMAALAHGTPGGEGNFRFAALACCPPGIPFFPAAYHEGERAFAIGLELPPLLQSAFEGANGLADGKVRLKAALNSALAEVEQIGRRIARDTGWRYLGIDTSPAPGGDASIGQAIETLTKTPFGDARTLSACAAITDVLKDLDVATCGYSGLMLPVIEDAVLARRAGEGRFTVSELLLYSSVCGTGLDVVPLPGDTSVEVLGALITDVAALAGKYRKPLSARLFPIPGKKAGDRVSFESPYLVPSVVMAVG